MWVELTYAKGGAGRFLGHLDVLRAFERGTRRAGVALVLTQGFNPRPRIVFASPLGVGATGQAERVALELAAPLAPEEVLARLRATAPAGLLPLGARALEGSKPPAYHLLPWAEWEIEPAPPGVERTEMAERVAALLATDSVEIERRTKSGTAVVDIRPAVLALEATGEGRALGRLVLNGETTAKPLEVLAALGFPRGDAAHPHPLVHRLALAPFAE